MRGVVKLAVQSPVEDRTIAPPHPFTLSLMYWSEASAAGVADFPAFHKENTQVCDSVSKVNSKFIWLPSVDSCI